MQMQCPESRRAIDLCQSATATRFVRGIWGCGVGCWLACVCCGGNKWHDVGEGKHGMGIFQPHGLRGLQYAELSCLFCVAHIHK